MSSEHTDPTRSVDDGGAAPPPAPTSAPGDPAYAQQGPETPQPPPCAGQQPGGPQAWQAPQPMSPQDARTYSILTHLSVFVVSFVGPLVALLAWGERDPFLRHHAVQALNFQILMAIGVVATVLGSILTLGIAAIVLVPLLVVAGIALPIVGAVKANNGEWWCYPATPQFVK